MKTVGFYFSKSLPKDVFNNESKDSRIERAKEQSLWELDLEENDVDFVICETIDDVKKVLNSDNYHNLYVYVENEAWHLSEESKEIFDSTKNEDQMVRVMHVGLTRENSQLFRDFENYFKEQLTQPSIRP